MFPVISICNCFTNGKGQDGFTVKFGTVQVVLDEFEFLHELVFLEIRVEVIQGEREFFVYLGLIFVLGFDAVVVFVFDYFLNQFDGRIVFTGIFFSFGFDDNFGYFEGGRAKVNGKSVILLSGFQVEYFSVVS